MSRSSSEPTAVERLAQFAAHLRADELPAEVLDKAKLCVLDALSGCLTLGSTLEGECAFALALGRADRGHASVYGSQLKTSPSDAAFVNAVNAAGTARTDTHAASATHPGPVVVPVALAMAEAFGASGRAVLEGVVVGYEVMCRLGSALFTPEFAAIHRPTGVAAPTAAAMAAGRVMGLDVAHLARAASLATHFASGLNEWTYAGTPELAYHSGFAARNAVDCALLAQMGVLSAPTILEGHAGLLAAYGASHQVAELTSGLGITYRILEVDHKPAPVCIYAQTPVQVAQRMLADCPDPHAIRTIAIHVSRAAALYPGCDNRGPITDAQAAKLSIQFAVGSVFAKRGALDTNWRDYTDSESNALAARCTLRIDERLTAASPGRQGSHIEVTLTNADTVRATQDDFAPMLPGAIIDRFARIAESRLGKVASGRVIALVQSLELLPGVAELASTLQTAMRLSARA